MYRMRKTMKRVICCSWNVENPRKMNSVTSVRFFSLHSSVSVSENNAGSQHREIPIVVWTLEQGQREDRQRTDRYAHMSRFPHCMINRQGAGTALWLLQPPPFSQFLLSPLPFVKPLRNDQYVRLLHTFFQVLILNMLFLQRVDERLFCFNDV